MKLHVRNFCCWEDNTFDFPDEGIVLISAPSGHGKTSIIRAIMFALFGIGQKIIKHGKKSCSVELWYKDLHVKRTKGPCRLVVNQSFEDKTGEPIIQRYFPNRLFYLEQNGVNNFINLSANDKLSLLENIMFQSIDLVSIKEDIKQRIKHREEQLLVSKTQLQTLNNVLHNLPTVPFVELPNDYSDTQLSYQESVYDSLVREYDDIRIRLEWFKKQQDRVSSIEKQLVQFRTRISSITDQIEELSLSTIDRTECTNLLSYYKQCKEYIEQSNLFDRISEEYVKQKKVYDTTFETEKKYIENDIETTRQSIHSLPIQNMDEIKRRIESCRQLEHNRRVKQQLETELEELGVMDDTEESVSQRIDELLYTQQELRNTLRELQNTYTCPSCSTQLQFQNDRLVVNDIVCDTSQCTNDLKCIDDKLKNERMHLERIRQHSTKRTYIQHKLQTLPTLQPCTDNIKDLEGIRDELVQYTTRLSTYTKKLERITQQYTQIRRQLDELKRECKRVRQWLEEHPVELETEDVHELTKQIYEMETRIQTDDKRQDQLHSLNRQLEAYNTQYSTLKHSLDQLVQEREFQECQSLCVGEWVDNIERQRKVVDMYRQYKVYNQYIQSVDTYQHQIRETEESIRDHEQKLSVELLFKQKIRETETTCLSNLIQTINSALQMYLDTFFEKHPLQVSLHTEKKSSKTKHVKNEIAVSVFHKGNEVDIHSLSGGEKDRVILAFTLALSHISNIPFVLLDECISSLDQSNADIVFNSIKHGFSDRLVILVAHQIVEGMFDKVLKLNS